MLSMQCFNSLFVKMVVVAMGYQHNINVALVPIGAYDPRWLMKNSHMNPEEAQQLVNDVGATRAIGMHWGTFALTNEPMAEPGERADATGVIETPKPGQIIDLTKG